MRQIRKDILCLALKGLSVVSVFESDEVIVIYKHCGCSQYMVQNVDFSVQ